MPPALCDGRSPRSPIPSLKPIEQNTARYYRRLAIDLEFGGIADNEEEGRRLVRVLGDKKHAMLGNHGVLVMGDTVAEAFDDLYYLERACQTLVLAYSTGQPLNVLSPEVAEATARGWEDYKDAAFSHFDELKASSTPRIPRTRTDSRPSASAPGGRWRSSGAGRRM